MARLSVRQSTSRITFPNSVCHRVTRRCNAACGFCQAPNNSRDQLTVAEIGTIARGLSERGVRTMKLSGGEPTIRPDIAAVVTRIGESGLTPVVLTNGISISPELLDAAVSCNAEFKVSIHRDTDENNRILRVKSFDQILSNLKRLAAAVIPYSIVTVVEPGSTSVIRPMARFAAEHGARKMSFIPVVPRGHATSKANYIFTDHELAEVRRLVRQVAHEFADRITVRIIDFRLHDYWIIENNGSLFIERWRDDLDIELLDKAELLSLLSTYGDVQ